MDPLWQSASKMQEKSPQQKNDSAIKKSRFQSVRQKSYIVENPS